ncbi:MAG: aminotransferase class V-fold PLP-dependent enzyme [Bacteroidota bacterium]
MQEALLKNIESLEALSAQLEPNEVQRSELLQKVQAYAQTYLEALPQRKAYIGDLPASDLSIQESPRSIEEILQLYQEEVAEKGIRASSPGHFGYIPGGGVYTSALGDYLVDVTNEYAGMYFASPGAVTIEHQVIDWTKKIFGFPQTAAGNITSGGSIANLTALTVARDQHQIKGTKIEQSVIYTSAHLHHCVTKSLRIIGLGDIIIRQIALDEKHRLQVESLQEQLAKDKEAGLTPFMVIASAGTTNTGAIDPLKVLGHICQEEGMWYHVDAAYGGYFILVDTLKPLFEGIEMADSLVVDPHKGLFIPYGAGIVLVKHGQALAQSMSEYADYMQDANQGSLSLNPADLSPELSKHFRGLRIWLPLQLHGIAPFRACLEEKRYLLTYFRERIQEMGFRVGPEPDLSVSYFWFPYEGPEIHAYNAALHRLMLADGTSFFSTTHIEDTFVIRVAIVSFRTKKVHVDRAVDMIAACKVQLDQQWTPRLHSHS